MDRPLLLQDTRSKPRPLGAFVSVGAGAGIGLGTLAAAITGDGVLDVCRSRRLHRAGGIGCVADPAVTASGDRRSASWELTPQYLPESSHLEGVG